MDYALTDYLSWYIPRLSENRDVIHLDASGVPSLTASDISIPATDPWTVIPLLEETLAEWQGAQASQIVFTPGATGGTLLALLTLADRDTEVVVESPIYEPMLRQAQRVATVRRLVRRQDEGYRLSLDAARRIITDRTSLVMITEPHNPSGRLSPRDKVLELAAIAEQHGARLLINEVYLGFTDQPSFLGAAENIVVVSSLSKLLGAYWARVGWLAAPAPEASRLRTAQLNMSMGSSLGAGYGLGVLSSAEQRRRAARSLANTGRVLVDTWLESEPRLSWMPPHGTGFACICLPQGVDDMSLAETLHARHDVLLIPGSLFEAPGTIRISWLQSGRRLAAGLDAISACLPR